jgi:hypothetical protein
MKIAKPSKYPKDATWQATNDKGQIGTIWLEKKSQYMDMWYYSVHYSDGSSRLGDMDWCPSYSLCRDQIPIWNKNGKKLRFKRIK